MCSHQEWERLARRMQDAVDERQVRQFVAGAVARLEEFLDEFKDWACPRDEADWVRGRGRQSRSDWIV